MDMEAHVVPDRSVPNRTGAGVRGDDVSPNLDLLRSLAVLFVVASHLLIDNAMSRIGNYHAQTLGTLGVMIFFVHTCLVLMRSLARQDDRHGGRFLARSFLLARAFRIYPLSIAVVLALAVVDRWRTHAPPDLSTFLSNVFLVQNLTGSPLATPVLWSLPFEVQMYLFLPALYWWTRSGARRPWRRVVFLWCAFVALTGVLWRLGVNVDLIKFFPCFLPGVLAYCMGHSLRRWSAGALFSYVGATALLYPLLVGLGASATVLSWIICLVLGALVPLCADVGMPWLRRLGSVVARYSYGIYLVHVSVLNFAFHDLAGLPRLLAWLIFFGGIVLLSYSMYHLVERPGIEFGRVLANRLRIAGARSALQVQPCRRTRGKGMR